MKTTHLLYAGQSHEISKPNVIPAKAGIQLSLSKLTIYPLDPRFRGDDKDGQLSCDYPVPYGTGFYKPREN